MGNPAARSAGWLKIPNALSGIPALGLYTGDSAERVPYVFGVGDTDTGRMSTSSRAGAALTIPDAYGFGEMWELRFTFAETGNSQRQGIFMDVRTSAANSSTVRGMEVTAQSEGDINVGTLSGGTFKAIPRGTSGTITNLFGLEAEITFNSSSFAGTVTLGAAIRGKVSLEDGATNTAIYGVYIDGEPITGAVTATAIFGSDTAANFTWKSALDVRGSLLETINTNQVRLMCFTDAAGTAKMLVYDPDSATTVSVANYA